MEPSRFKIPVKKKKKLKEVYVIVGYITSSDLAFELPFMLIFA